MLVALDNEIICRILQIHLSLDLLWMPMDEYNTKSME